ncbi:MAG: methyltransferase [Myxococcales bacterium]|nr:methyltransferase [Myxococcales bacterium]
MQQRLQQLADLLERTQPLWEPRPFRQRPASWEATLPEVALWLRDRRPAEIDALEQDPFALSDMPGAYAALAMETTALTKIAQWPRQNRPPGKPMRGVKGRKQRQIEAFQLAVSAPITQAQPQRLIDWCGGKGHLSRLLATQCSCPVCVIDLSEAFVTASEQLGAAVGVDVTGIAGDVTTLTPPPQMDSAAGLVALHACGMLTDAALHWATQREVPWLALVPCCHHKAPEAGWRPRSKLLMGQDFRLPATALRMAISDEGPASPGARQRRRREMCWRIAVDLLLADRGETPLGSVGRTDYNRPFGEFCQWAMARRGLDLPTTFDADRHHRRAAEATRHVRGLSLLRGLFRRPVELLCVLDRAQSLADVGYQTQVATFCERAISPRNLLIVASRSSAI